MSRPLNLIVVLVTLFPICAQAQTTHVVMVNDNFFEPQSITIQAGDTVRWENPPGGMNHNVLADDLSFNSGPLSSTFTFEHRFTQGGAHPYFCQPHRIDGMTGTINVEGNIEPEPTFSINAGLNDAWYNPATSGQGFFITVFPDLNSVFLAWFTYDTERPDPSVTSNLGEPGHRWVTGYGEFSGNSALLDVELTTGGVFNAASPQPTQSADGTILLECGGCNDCTVTYDIESADLQGVVPIERIGLGNVPACETLAEDE